MSDETEGIEKSINPIEFDLTYTKNDYCQAWVQILNRVNLYWIYYIIFLVALVVSFYLWITSDFANLNGINTLSILFIVALLLYYQYILPANRYDKHKAYFQKERTAVFDTNYIVIKTETGETKFLWTSFRSVLVFKSSYSFLTKEKQQILIPCRILAKTDYEERLLALLKQKADEKLFILKFYID